MSDGPDPTRGPFEVFDLPRDFVLDPAELERRLLQLSREHHPDRAGPDPDARARATLRSAQIHEAYAVLSDPERRAEWLLAAAGGPSSEQDKRTPEGFLESMLELRMEVEEAKAGGAAEVDALESRFRAELRRVRAEVAEAMAGLDPAREGGGDAALRARASLNELAFHKRLLADLLDR